MGSFVRVSETGSGHVHRKKDNVHLFASVAGVLSIISGILLYLMLLSVSVPEYLRVLGLVWVLFGLLDFYALYVFEYENRRNGGRMLAIIGIVGFMFGLGFFIGALMMVFSGLLAIKYSVRKIGKKID